MRIDHAPATGAIRDPMVAMIDEARLLYPGDPLHGAGHLAMPHSNGNMGDDADLKMAAIAWSYAAAIPLGVPAVLFHEAG